MKTNYARETKGKGRASLKPEQTRYVCVWRGRELELQRMFKQLKRNLKASTNRSHNGELHETEDVPEEENAGPSRKKVALAASHRQQQRSEGLMLDNVLRALYHHHELDQDLVRSYVPLFLKLSGELRMTIGE